MGQSPSCEAVEERVEEEVTVSQTSKKTIKSALKNTKSTARKSVTFAEGTFGEGVRKKSRKKKRETLRSKLHKLYESERAERESAHDSS